MPALAPNWVDQSALALKAGSNLMSALGPFSGIGPAVAEMICTTIPNQRQDRIVEYVRILQGRLSAIEKERFVYLLGNEFFLDLNEEVLRQAVRALRDQRRANLANFVATSMGADDPEFVESRHLLRLYAQLSDEEAIWLKYKASTSYRAAEFGFVPGEEDWDKYDHIIGHMMVFTSSPPEMFERKALQESWQDHLAQLGLFDKGYEIDSDTGAIEVSSFDGIPKVRGYAITDLGLMLARYIFNDGETESDPPTETQADDAQSGG